MDPSTPEASALAPGMHEIRGEVTAASTAEMSAADVTFASLAYPLILPKEKAKVF